MKMHSRPKTHRTSHTQYQPQVDRLTGPLNAVCLIFQPEGRHKPATLQNTERLNMYNAESGCLYGKAATHLSGNYLPHSIWTHRTAHQRTSEVGHKNEVVLK